jgi:hypothetical protein
VREEIKNGSDVSSHRRTNEAHTSCLIDLLQSSYHSLTCLGGLGSRFLAIATQSKMKPCFVATLLTTTPPAHIGATKSKRISSESGN